MDRMTTESHLIRSQKNTPIRLFPHLGIHIAKESTSE